MLIYMSVVSDNSVRNENENENRNSNEELYQQSKQDVLSAVERNVKTIMLVGSGGNGKSYLTNELKSVLESNGYVIYSPDTSYCWKEADVFLENMNTVEKKVVHLLFDPYHKWCLEPPVDVAMVMMDGIRW